MANVTNLDTLNVEKLENFNLKYLKYMYFNFPARRYPCKVFTIVIALHVWIKLLTQMVKVPWIGLKKWRLVLLTIWTLAGKLVRVLQRSSTCIDSEENTLVSNAITFGSCWKFPKITKGLLTKGKSPNLLVHVIQQISPWHSCLKAQLPHSWIFYIV